MDRWIAGTRPDDPDFEERHKDDASFWFWSHISDTRHLGRTVRIQFDIMIGTLCLLVGVLHLHYRPGRQSRGALPAAQEVDCLSEEEFNLAALEDTQKILDHPSKSSSLTI